MSTNTKQKLVLRASVILIASLASSIALGQTWSDSYRLITHIYPHDTGITFILDGAVVVPASPCPNRFLISLSDPNYTTKVAALLSVHAQGKRIQINYDETNNTCDVPVNRFVTED